MPGQDQDRKRDAGKRRMLPFVIIPIIFLIAGIAALSYSLKLGLIWIVFCVYFTVVIIKNMGGKSAQSRKKDGQNSARPDRGAPSAAQRPVWLSSAASRPAGYERAARRGAQTSGREHDHIRSIALSPRRKLEQLETLRGAGLLTDEEYREEKKKILRQI